MHSSEELTALLLRATYSGDRDMALRLLDNGADVNSADKRGWTPLLRAAQRGHSTLSELFLSRGADIDATDRRGRTALLWATRNGDAVLARELLARGASVYHMDENGNRPLDVAVTHSRTSILALILPIYTRNRVQYPLQRALLRAIQNVGVHHASVTIALLDAGADPGARLWAETEMPLYVQWQAAPGPGGWWFGDDTTPLIEAAQWGHEDVTRLLLNRGADPKARTRQRRSPLTEALWRTRHHGPNQIDSVIGLLRRHGVRIGLEDAVVLGDIALVRRLLDEGTIGPGDIEAEDSRGERCWHGQRHEDARK